MWIAEADDLSDSDFLDVVLPPLISGDAVLSYCESQQMNSQGIIQTQNYHEYLADVCHKKWKNAYLNSGVDEIKSSLAILNTIPNVSAVVFNRMVISDVFDNHIDEIARYKKAGDYVVYIHALLSGNIAFTPRNANLHRRHEVSVIGNSSFESLLKEIIEVQEMIASKFEISDEVLQKIDAYRLKLTHLMGL